MADKPPSLQDEYLNACRRAKAPVTLFLMKGIKLQGVLTWFDAFSMLLRRDGNAQLIYKHSVSTILAAAPLDLGDRAGGAGKGRATLQDLFLAAAERGAEPVTLFLVNGVMLQGSVAAHDQFALLLRRDEQVQLVYKHAISTIQPAGPLDLGSVGDESEPA